MNVPLSDKTPVPFGKYVAWSGTASVFAGIFAVFGSLYGGGGTFPGTIVALVLNPIAWLAVWLWFKSTRITCPHCGVGFRFAKHLTTARPGVVLNCQRCRKPFRYPAIDGWDSGANYIAATPQETRLSGETVTECTAQPEVPDNIVGHKPETHLSNTHDSIAITYEVLNYNDTKQSDVASSDEPLTGSISNQLQDAPQQIPSQNDPEIKKVDGKSSFLTLSEHQRRGWTESASCIFTNSDFTGISFKKAKLQKAILDGCIFTNCDFTDADLSECSAIGANFEKTVLSVAHVAGANFTAAKLSEVDLRKCLLRHTTLKNARLFGAMLQGCDIQGVDLSECDLINANLDGVVIDDATRFPVGYGIPKNSRNVSDETRSAIESRRLLRNGCFCLFAVIIALIGIVLVIDYGQRVSSTFYGRPADGVFSSGHFAAWELPGFSGWIIIDITTSQSLPKGDLTIGITDSNIDLEQLQIFLAGDYSGVPYYVPKGTRTFRIDEALRIHQGRAQLKLNFHAPAMESANIFLRSKVLNAEASLKVTFTPKRGNMLAPFAATSTVKENHQKVDGGSSHATLTEENIVNSVKMTLKRIPAGEFLMGAPRDELGYGVNESPQHLVRISNSFYMSVTEVTQDEWVAVMGNQPWQGDNHVMEGACFPAVCISMHDAASFCRTLSASEGRRYRLPTEAEWEYACRGGASEAFCYGADVGQLPKYAWCQETLQGHETKGVQFVRGKLPNDFGLYDMHGNVWEWCVDWVGDYPSTLAIDPSGPLYGSYRVIRGGSWFTPARECRSAFRGRSFPTSRDFNKGFRVVLCP